MANEIAVQVSLQVTNGNLSFLKRDNYNADQASAGGPSNGVQSIGTTYEAVAITDLTNLGMVYFGNLDSTNYVEVGVDVSSAFYPFLKLKAGESAVMRLSPAITVYAKANTAAVKLETYCFEA